MRLSQYWLHTQKEAPAEAEIISHQLMLRAGMVRQTALGIYSWLPLGLRVLRKIENIVREEMNNSGALELLMPAVQPAELWQQSGRWQDYGAELLRLQDRHQRDYCLGPTHEEVITDIIRRDLHSYKQLPVNFYQIQTKFRDEIRPRFGIMRGREFVMKDGYSFHRDNNCLQQTYDAMFAAYCRIFERIGLQYRAVIADNGAIGGSGSHEFHVIAKTGEDSIVFCEDSDYAANVESARALVSENNAPSSDAAMQKRATPNCKTIAELVTAFELPIERTLKTIIVHGTDKQLIALVLRGDHQLNEIKAQHHPKIAAPLQFATEEEIKTALGVSCGSLGVVNLNIESIVDCSAAAVCDFACGANEDGYHYFNVNWHRDAPLGAIADIRNVVAGDLSPDGKGKLSIARGIEVGHIFQLDSKYSAAMDVQVVGEDGNSFAPLMGCYGIGVSRIVAAAIEQNHDEKGIILPKSIAAFHVAILPINAHKSERVQQEADAIYRQLIERGVEVILDDRRKRAGFMFADIDLIGISRRIVISDKLLDDGEVEFKLRTSDSAQRVALQEIVAVVVASLQDESNKF